MRRLLARSAFLHANDSSPLCMVHASTRYPEEESSGHFLADVRNGNVTMIPKSGGGMWDLRAVV